MEPNNRHLEQAALDVLRRNDRGNHIAPNRKIYPNAWLWDTVFVAHGLSHVDPGRAASELDYIFEGQWDNGMIPHMRMEKGLFNTSRLLNRNAPKHILTSGITQPPILAEAVQRVSEKLPTDDGRAFVHKLFGPLANYHQWIYRERSPNDNGRFAIVHKDESGMDNSPALVRHTGQAKLVGKVLHLTQPFLHHIRPDVKHTGRDQRSSNYEIVLSARSLLSVTANHFDHRLLRDKHPIHIEDVFMTAALARNNQVLEQLSDEYKLPLPNQLRENMAKTPEGLEGLYDEDSQMYFPRDALSGQSIKEPAIASIMPIYASDDIKPERFDALVRHLENSEMFSSDFGVPSVPFSSPHYEENRYWCGPSWAFTDWLLAEGLRHGGRPDLARKIGNSLIARTERDGFYECFSAKTGQGVCIDDFSPTAALTIDFLHRYQED